MGIYGERVLPRIQDVVMRRPAMQAPRARVCSGLHGEVVELGFGTGLNARYYPDAISRVRAIEPSAVCLRLAAPRIAAAPATVDVAGLDGARLDLPSASCDSVLSTWTLCTIPDLDAALSEVARVLRPGGSFHFVEHGLAPEPGVVRWQRRLEPVHKRIAGGCHLTRPISEHVVDAGFRLDELDTYYLEGEPRPYGYTFEGRARVGRA